MNEVKDAGLQPTGMSGRIEMRTPHEVSAMLALKSCGWGTKRIAAELGCLRNTVKRWIAEAGWRAPPAGTMMERAPLPSAPSTKWKGSAFSVFSTMVAEPASPNRESVARSPGFVIRLRVSPAQSRTRAAPPWAQSKAA